VGSSLVYFLPKFNFNKIYFNGLAFVIASSILCSLIFYAFNLITQSMLLHNFILSFLFSMISFHQNIFLAKQKIRSYNFTLWLQPLLTLSLLLISLFYFHQQKFSNYFLCIYFSATITFLITLIKIISCFKSENFQEFNLNQVLKNGLQNQLANLAHILSNRINYYLLAIPALVGVFASASSLIESVLIISTSISPIVLSKIANSKSSTHNYFYTLRLAFFSFILSILAVIILLFIPPHFFSMLLGKDFSLTKSIMLCLSPGIIFISFSSILSHYFSGLGKQNILLRANLLGLVLAACSVYLLISNYGIYGACISTCISYLGQASLLSYYFWEENSHIK
jgi:O-antigen/teichoic acid export membrane protein